MNKKENLFSRSHILSNLKEQKQWDVIIIGGGATGLGIAVDSATRGYKTLLLEQVDFAKATSSRSTKLVHGGVRYLEQGNIDLVREALHERGLLFKNAPHLVQTQNFIIPNYKWWEGMFYTLGLKVYDLLAVKLSLGKSTHLKRKETLKRLPSVRKKGLRGGVLYRDGQFDDARLAINLAQTALEKGASLLNYFEVNGLLQEKGKIIGVKALDKEAGLQYTLKAKTVINATGIFTDEILRMQDPKASKTIKPSQGVHLVFDREFLPGKDALMIPKTDDGRVLFAVPWHTKLIVGTTDTPLEESSLEPQALEKEIDFILDSFNKYLDKKVTRKEVRSVYAGLRPLAAPEDEDEESKEISRSHKILVSESGLITITGGKWTTYRKMAEDTLDKAISLEKLPKATCKTEALSLHGSIETKDLQNHLYIYGSDKPELEKLMQQEPELAKKLHERLPFFKAEVVWAVRYEMARTLDDVLSRRVRALFLDAAAALEIAPEVVQLIAKELDRDEAWQKQQLKEFKKITAHYMLK